MLQTEARIPVFFCAPHRVMFFAGAFQLIAVILFWLIELSGRYTTLWPPLTATVSSTWIHAFFMLYGLYTFFIFGFLMTTFPRWLNTAAIGPRHYLPCFFLMSSGILLVYAGLFLSRSLLLAGVFSFLCGWATGLYTLLKIYLRSGKKPSLHETTLAIVMTLGLLSAACGCIWLLSDNAWCFQVMLTGGIWLYLLPVLIVVCHRMIPFFSASALAHYTLYRPFWPLPLIAAGLAGHALVEIAGALRWSCLFDLPIAATAFHLSLRWKLLRSFKVPLLAMLHLAFLWLSIAMLLYGIQSLVLLLSGNIILGKAPLHSIGIGFIASMVLAMATRVTLGHSGRILHASKTTLFCFFLLQLAAICRLLNEIIHGFDINVDYLNLAAGTLWLIGFGIWVSIYMPMLVRPRIDGKPG